MGFRSSCFLCGGGGGGGVLATWRVNVLVVVVVCSGESFCHLSVVRGGGGCSGGSMHTHTHTYINAFCVYVLIYVYACAANALLEAFADPVQRAAKGALDEGLV